MAIYYIEGKAGAGSIVAAGYREEVNAIGASQISRYIDRFKGRKGTIERTSVKSHL